MKRKQKYLKIVAIPSGGHYIAEFKEEQISIVWDMLQDSDVGTGYGITIVEMTPEEYEKLPEFCGF